MKKHGNPPKEGPVPGNDHCPPLLLTRRLEQWVPRLENVSDFSHCCSNGLQSGFGSRHCSRFGASQNGFPGSASPSPGGSRRARCRSPPARTRPPARRPGKRIFPHCLGFPCSGSASCASSSYFGTTPSPASLLNPAKRRSPLASVCTDIC